jgi:acetoin utilization protein AcuC
VGNLFNLPLPKHSHDDDLAYVLNELALPALHAFGPDAIVLQCGADAVQEDPQSTLAMSNNAHFDVIRALLPLCPRFLLLGGGGYNPWSVGRLWTGAWGVLNGIDPPRDLNEVPRRVLEALSWSGHRLAKNRPTHWSSTLRDDPRYGPIKEEVRDRVCTLRKRLSVIF